MFGSNRKAALIILGFILIVVFYLVTRLANITLLPVFVDEAIYIRWSQVMKNEPTLRFLPQSDGKPPLFMWLMMPVFKFISDPLFAGRFVSILAGLGTLLTIFVTSLVIFSSPVLALLAGAAYVINPFATFFDRQALADSLLAFFGLMTLFVGLLLVRKPRFDLGFVLGFILGGALLTKPPAMLFILSLPVLLLTLPKKRPGWYWLTLGASVLLALVISQVFYNILRLGPNFHLINSRNYDYVFPLSEVLRHPLNPLQGNLYKTLTWLANFYTLPLLLLAPFSLLSSKKRLVITLWLWLLSPLIAQSLVAKVYTTRYFLFIVPTLCLLSAIGLDNLLRKCLKIENWKLKISLISIAILITFANSVWYLSFFYTSPVSMPMPQQMAHGYFQEWTAGDGIKEIAALLKVQAGSHQVLVGTEGFFGTLPDGLQMYTDQTPHLTIIGVGQPIVLIPQSLTNSLVDNDVYLVVNRSRNQLPESELVKMELLQEYVKSPRPDGSQEALQFYRLKPQITP